MTSKITFFTLVVFFTTLQVSFCQDFANAVLIKKITPNNKYHDSLYQKTKDILQKSSGSDILLYDWDAKTHAINFRKDNKSAETPSKNIVFIDPIYSFADNPEIKLSVDTTGKTTGVYFEIAGSALIHFKALETATSKVVKIKTIEVIKAFSERINIPDFAKEFGGDPNAIRKSNSTSYNAACKKVLAKFWPQAEKKYFGTIHDATYPLSSLKKEALVLQPIFYQVDPTTVVDGKSIKLLKLKSGTDDGIYENQSVDVYVKRKVEDYFYYDKIESMYIKTATANSSEAKTLLFGSKDVAAALINKEEMIVLPAGNKYIINYFNAINKDNIVNMALVKKCLFCAMEDELNMVNSITVNLVERNAPELNYFNDLLKNEKFIDLSVEDLQGKTLGFQILVSNDGEFVNAINVANNVNFASIEVGGKILGVKTYGNIDYDVIFKVLNAFNPKVYNMEIVKMLEVKKNKVEKVLAYNPVGFSNYEKLVINVVKEEEVDGETIYRNEKVGEARIGKIYSANIAEVKIKDGEKEIFDIISAGGKVFINYPTKQK